MSSKKKKTKSSTATIEREIKAKFRKHSDELLKQHLPELLQILEESEDHSVPFTFQGKLDCSESEPSLTTRLRFAQTVTDERTELLDDGKQGRLFDDDNKPKAKLEPEPKKSSKTPKQKKSGKKTESRKKATTLEILPEAAAATETAAAEA